MTSGHSQELKTQAVAQQVGKRLRILLSYNNAGIDDSLVGGVVSESMDGYEVADQWSAYGWNVLAVDDGNDYDHVLAALRTMEGWDPDDRRPMIVVGRTTKGWWPAARDSEIPGFGPQVVGYPSHPYSMKMNSPYFVALAETFERRYGVEFQGIRDGAAAGEAERLRQFKTNVDVAMSVLEQDGLGDWLTDRLVDIGDRVRDDVKLRFDVARDPFCDDRLRVGRLPVEPQTVSARLNGEAQEIGIELFKPAGAVAGTRRAISEVIKWMNHVTGNRFLTLSADLSSSINVEKGSLTGHYDPRFQPGGDAAQGGHPGGGQRFPPRWGSSARARPSIRPCTAGSGP